jgi:uncharacterized membrane protein YeaQ/YmgE (transglycosylase-associated protein family)
MFLILGGLAGWFASMIMRTDAEQGIGLNILVGCIGALLGGILFNLAGAEGVTGFNLWSLFVAVLGAVRDRRRVSAGRSSRGRRP